MLPADDVLGTRDRMLADSPAALDVAVVAAINRNQPADDRDLAQVGAESKPEAISGPGQVVGPHHVKDPVPHKAALLCVMRESLSYRRSSSAGTGLPNPAPRLSSASTRLMEGWRRGRDLSPLNSSVYLLIP
jgi:hypothetical protein